LATTGVYFWQRLGSKMSKYIYTKDIVDVQGDTPISLFRENF